MLSDGLGIARLERSQLGTGRFVEFATCDVLVDLGRTVAVGRDVVPVVAPAPVALVAVRGSSTVVASGGVPTTPLTLAVVAAVTARAVPATALRLAVITTAAVALALTTRPPLTRPIITTITPRGVPPTALSLAVITTITARAVPATALRLAVITTAAVALALTTRPPLTRPIITTITARAVPATALSLAVITTITPRGVPATALSLAVITTITPRGVPTTTLSLAVITTAAVALALTTRPPLTRPIITTITPRGVPTTAIVLPVVAGPVDGASSLGAASARLAVASGAAPTVVEPAPVRSTGPVALAPGSSAGPAIAGTPVPALVPGPVLERLGHVPLLCADAVPVGSRGCRR
ncbi:hypothetical protein [Kocuria aegyptia]|uniref:hypothetical protein n=1 Tax=Kocuria aegyptia TaxID=330943 RepID=UPI0031D008E7